MVKIDRTYNAFRNIIFGTLSKVYQTIIPFVMRWMILHFFGAEYLGLNGLFVSVLQILNLAELGVGSAMMYTMYKPIAENDTKRLCQLLGLYRRYYRIIGSAIFLIGLLIVPIIDKLIYGDVPVGVNIYILYFINLMTVVMSYWVFAYRISILEAHQRADVMSKVMIITDTIKMVLQIIAIVVFRNYYLFTLVAFATQLLTNVFASNYAKRIYPDLNAENGLPKELVVEIKIRIKDIFTSKFGGVVVNSADTVVISAFLGLSTLAVYENYYYIMITVYGFILICFNSCVAGVGNSLVTESMDKNYTDFKGLSFGVNWVCCICICCFLNLYQPFIKLWIGQSYLLPYTMVVLFCVYFYLYTITNFWCVYKNASGIWHEDRFRPLAGASLNLLLNLCFVNVSGLYAILLSTIASYVLITIPWLIVNLFKLLFLRNAMNYIKSLIKSIFVIFVCSIVSILLCENISICGIFGLVFDGVISVVVAFVLYLLAFVKTNEFDYFRTLIKSIVAK